MATLHAIAGSAEHADIPHIRRIQFADVLAALREGVDDFAAMPSHAIFLGVIYPIVGLLLGRMVFGLDLLPMFYPLAAGFALLGPVAALGLYELSRRRERNAYSSLRDAFDVFYSPGIGSISVLAALLLVIFLVWLATANALYVSAFGYAPVSSVPDFLKQLFTTEAGRWLIVTGNLVGFLFAVGVFVISVVSFPLLLERNVGAVVAILTSVRAVMANPLTMALWGLVVAVVLALASIPLLVGLAVAVPVLGHATWHLYRRVVEP